MSTHTKSSLVNENTTKQKTRKSALLQQPLKTLTTNLTSDVVVKFTKSCRKFNSYTIPRPVISVDEKVEYVSDFGSNTIFLNFRRIANDEYLETVIYKNSKIETGIIIALKNCFDNQKYFSVLRLENCNLTADQVEILRDLLLLVPSIKELSIKGNPIFEQNYHILLQKTKITSLSLKFCDINIEGIKGICNQLSKPLDSSLLHLNLASNSLFDEGASYIADLLRTNRTLLSLNLADNKITSEGCIDLMESLQKFQLRHEEVVTRRRIKFDLQKRNLMLGSISSPSKNNKQFKKERTPKNSAPATGSKQFWSTCLIPAKEYHPFIDDSNEEGSEICCKGNDVLINLNLSYNRITKEGKESIIGMLNYQRIYGNDKGISRITTERNEFNKRADEPNEITELLAMKLKRPSSIGGRTRSLTSLKKRSSRQSIT